MNNVSTVAGTTEKVHVDKKGKVDKDKVDLYKSKGDQMVWSADNETTISFASADKSPFTEWQFPVPAGGNSSTAVIRSNAEPGSYPYTVRTAGSQNDPTVIIHN